MVSVRVCIAVAAFGAILGLVLRWVLPPQPPDARFMARAKCMEENDEELRRRGGSLPRDLRHVRLSGTGRTSRDFEHRRYAWRCEDRTKIPLEAFCC